MSRPQATKRRVGASFFSSQPNVGASFCHPDREPEPAGGSELWPRPGRNVGPGSANRPLAGDGASRRPKAVSNGPSGGIYGVRLEMR